MNNHKVNIPQEMEHHQPRSPSYVYLLDLTPSLPSRSSHSPGFCGNNFLAYLTTYVCWVIIF